MAPLTIPDILRWDPAAIYDVFRVVKLREQTFADFGTHLQRVQNTLADWGGDAGEAFHEAMRRRRQDIDQDGHESTRVAAAVNRAEQDVESVRTRLMAALSFARENHLNVADDGTVTIQPGFETNEAAKKALAFEQQGRGVPGYELTIRSIMASAERVDDELAAAIRAAVGDEQLDEYGRPIPGTRPPPPAPPLLTADQLSQIFPTLSKADAERYAGPLSDAMRAAGMTSPEARAAFLATFAVESGELRYSTELRSRQSATEMYGPEYAGVTFGPGTPRDPDTPLGYQNSSAVLGNTQPGDGDRFRGRGPIQLTGRSNYTAAGNAIGVDLVNHPELAAAPENEFRIATWFWNNHHATLPDGTTMPLNQAAETGNFAAVTQAINGGLTGYPERLEYFNKAVAILSH